MERAHGLEHFGLEKRHLRMINLCGRMVLPWNTANGHQIILNPSLIEGYEFFPSTSPVTHYILKNCVSLDFMVAAY